MKSITYPILMIITALALFGCHGAPRPDTVYREAGRIPQTPKPVVKEVKIPVPTPQLRPLPSKDKADKQGEAATSKEAIKDAKEKATRGPTPDGFIRAVQTYDYLPGVVYQVFTSPGHVTTIALAPNEKLIAKAAGDTARWVVGDSHTGSGPSARTLLLVKPLKPNVETNLVISTNERVYQLDLKSLPDVYQSAVRWNYPQALAKQLAHHYAAQAKADSDVLDQDVHLTKLDFGYRIQSQGDKPDWTPRRVFTDGHKTYIAFPKNLATMQAPPLFVLGRKDEAQLVNYRAKGNYYIVDRVIDRAELRLGKDPQRIVHIQRIDE